MQRQPRVPVMPLPEFPSVRETVHDVLRKMIFSGALAPGDRLVEAELARQLGTSRAPVREAVRQLEQDGLLQHIPRRGCVVTPLSREDIRDLYSLRALIEGFAIRRTAIQVSEETLSTLEELLREMEEAAERQDITGLINCDVRFHDRIVSEAGSKQLHRVWSLLNPQTWTIMSVTVLGGRTPVAIAQRHRPVLDAIASRDPERAEVAIKHHILELAEELAASLPDPTAGAASSGPNGGRARTARENGPSQETPS